MPSGPSFDRASTLSFRTIFCSSSRCRANAGMLSSSPILPNASADAARSLRLGFSRAARRHGVARLSLSSPRAIAAAIASSLSSSTTWMSFGTGSSCLRRQTPSDSMSSTLSESLDRPAAPRSFAKTGARSRSGLRLANTSRAVSRTSQLESASASINRDSTSGCDIAPRDPTTMSRSLRLPRVRNCRRVDMSPAFNACRTDFRRYSPLHKHLPALVNERLKRKSRVASSPSAS
jgi:hypothetical protein